MIGGEDSHDRFAVQGLQAQRRQPYGSGGIPSERLEQQIFVGELRELLPDQASMRAAAHHHNPRPRQQEPNTLYGRLKKGLLAD